MTDNRTNQNDDEHENPQEHMQERRYLWSIPFWLHLPLTITILFFAIGSGQDLPEVWLIVFVVLMLFAYSAKLYTKGEDAKAIFLTFGSVLLGFFALFAACIQDFSRVH